MRIGAVNYLNSKPLVEGLAGRVAPARLVFDLPSRLADGLAVGRLDVALIPVVEFFRNPDYRMVSDAVVAARDAVRSVKLFFRVPPQEVRTLALDEGSRTSAALAQTLLDTRLGLRPAVTRLPIGEPAEAADADAILLIGDRAMVAPRMPLAATWDLGAEWRKETGLPFVFACWAARPGVDPSAVAPALAAARDDGLAHLPQIAHREAPALGLEPADALAYLSQNLHFKLGRPETRSLSLFGEHCRRLGFLTTPLPPLNPAPLEDDRAAIG